MSKLVDERVVELKFDNSDFERHTKQSMATVRDMKASLNFSGMAASINNAINSVDFSPITDALESSKKSFSAWEVVAINIISRITQDVISLGKEMIENLSVDNIKDGWTKYESLAKSTATIVNELSNTMSEQDAMKLTEEYLEKMMWYSDATSYSIEQMTSAFSKFIKKGYDVEKAYNAAVGVSNWAASAGKDVTETAGIYEAISKMSDHVTMRYWMSIQTANMDTIEFKKRILETAAAMGTLTKSGERFDGTIEYLTDKGNIVTAENFTDAFADGWFKVDEVLMKVLNDYGLSVDKVKEYQNENNLATPFDALEQYTDKLKIARAEAVALGDAEKVAAIDLELFSLKTFDAASEARTLTDAIRATKDAVSTGWTKAFQKLAGDYQEATSLFSDFADELTAIFTAPTEAINNALQLWRGYTPEVIEEQKLLINEEKELEEKRKDLTKDEIKEYEDRIQARIDYINQLKEQNDHRKDLFGTGEEQGALWNLIDTIKSVVDSIKKAWLDVFPIKKSLSDITSSIKEFTKNLIPTEEASESIRGVFRGLFSILNLVKKAFDGILIAINPIKDVISGQFGSLLGILGKVGNKFADFVDNLQIFNTIGQFVGNTLKYIIDTLKELKIVDKIKESFSKLGEELKERFNGKGELGQALDSLKDSFMAIWNILLSGLKEFLKFMVNNVLPVMVNAIKYVVIFASYVANGVRVALEKIVKKISEFAEAIKSNENIQNGWKNFIEFMKSIPSRLAKLQPFFEKLGTAISNFFKTLLNGIKSFGAGLASIFNIKSIGELFAKIGEKIKYGFDKIVAGIQSFKAARMDNAIDGVKKKMTPLQTLFQGLIDLFVGLKDIFLALIVVVGSVLSTVGNMLTTLATNIKNLFNTKLASGAKGLDIWAIINGGVAVLIAKGLYDFIWLFRSITNVIKDTIDSVGAVFRGKAVKEWAEAMKTVAEAMLMLVASLLLITMIDEQKLKDALSTLITLMGILTACIAVIGKFMNTAYSMKADALFEKGFLGSFSRTGNSWGGVAKMILSFGLAILALVAALKIITKINPTDLERGFVTLVGLMVILTLCMGLMNALANVGNKSAKGVRGISGMLSFSLAILIFAFSIKRLSSIELSKMITPLIAIFTIVTLFGGLIALSSAMGNKKVKGINGLITMAIAMMLMIIPLREIGKIPLGDVAKAVSVIGLISVTYAAIMQITKNVKVTEIAAAILIMATLGILLATISNLIAGPIKDIRWEDMVKFGLIIAAIIGTLYFLGEAISNIFSNRSPIAKATGGSSKLIKGLALIALTMAAISVTLLSIVVLSKMMDTINWDSMIGLFGVLIGIFGVAAVMIASAYGLSKIIDSMPNLVQTLLLFIMVIGALVTAAYTMAFAARAFNNVSWDAFGMMMASMAALMSMSLILMSILTVISRNVESMPKLVQTLVIFGIIMTALVSTVNAMAYLVKLYSSINPGTMAIMLASLAAMLTMAVAVYLICAKVKINSQALGNIYALSTIMLALSAMMIGFATLIYVMNKMNPNNIIPVLLMMVVAVTALTLLAGALGGTQGQKFAEGSKTLLKLGAALLLFAVAAAAFAIATSMLTSNLKGLLIFAGILLALGIAGKMLGSAAPSLLMVGVAFLAIGAAALALGAAFYLIVKALQELLPILDELAAHGDQLQVVIENIVAGVVKGVADAIPVLTKKILEGADILLQDLLAKVRAILDWFLNLDLSKISKYLDKINALLLLVLSKTLEFLEKNVEALTKSAVMIFISFIIGVIKGVTARLGELIQALADFIVEYLNVMAKAIDDNWERITDAIWNFITSLWNAIWGAVGKIFGNIGAALDKHVWKPFQNWYTKIVRDSVNAVKKWGQDIGNAIGNFFNSIKNWVSGEFNKFGNWVRSKIFDPITNFFKSLGTNTINLVKKIFGIHSPSTVFEEIGENVAAGFILGVDNKTDEVEETMSDMSDAANEGFDLTSQESYDKKAEDMYSLISKALIDKSGIIYDTIKSIIDKSISLIDGSGDYFRESILNIVSIIENNITDDDLTIRPVMDLTEIQNGIIEMKSMLNEASSIRVEASSRAANTVSAERARAVWREHAESQNNSINPTSAGEVYNVTFNITGDDPKAIADEVSKVFQHKVSRRSPRW